MKALYVTTPNALDGTVVLADLVRLESALEVQSVVGATAALVELRTARDYAVLLLSPSVPRNEALALISTLRRDRHPIVIVAIVTDDDRGFFAPAVTAGADDVVVFRERRLIAVEDTLHRIRQNRHRAPEGGQVPLRVLYAGQDDRAWESINTIHFVQAGRTTPDADGAVSLQWNPSEGSADPCDALIVDEHPGAAHALQVVKWAKTHHPDIPVVVLTPPTAGDVGGAALELGADDSVGKAGNYRRRLLATLHRLFVRRRGQVPPAAAAATERSETPPVKSAPPPAASNFAANEEIDRLRTALGDAESRSADASAELESAREALHALRTQHERLVETLAFERVLRTRDREELAALSRELHAERERRTVLEGTLRQTEDQMQGEMSALRDAHQLERRQLEDEVVQAADRLHEVAHATQVLEARLELQLAERAAERDRLMDNALVGYATFTRGGRLTRCSATFASMLGYPSAEDAIEMHAGRAFPGTPDHARVVTALEDPGASGTGRVESIVRRHDGRPVRVLTSAVLVPAARNGADEDLVERLFVDLTDRARAETELRLARRLESVGRLTAEMAPQIEAALGAADDPAGDPADRERLALLVRQLLAFSQLQAKPAGYLSLNDAIARNEIQLRQLAGDAIDLQLRLGEIEPIAAGEDDIEHLVIELVSTMAGCLPYGGRLTIGTATETDPTFVLRTLISASAAGYGVLPVHLSSSLARLVARCGGVVQVADDAGRTSMLHVLLPC